MPAETVSDEISQLMRKGPSRGPRKGQKYTQKQAVAAALDMQRRGDNREGPKMRKRKSKKRASRY